MLGADGEIAQLFGPGIDDLMRRFTAARRAGDNVARANWVSCLPDSYFAATLQHEKHLLLGRVIVKRHGSLARWHSSDVVTELLGTDACTDQSRLCFESLGGGSGRREHRRRRIERDVGKIHDRFRFGHMGSPDEQKRAAST